MLHGIAHQPAEVDTPLAAASQQPRAFQNAYMPGDRRQRDAVRRGEFADRRFAAREPVQNGPPRGIGQGAERRIERRGSVRPGPASPLIGTRGHRRATT